MLVHSTLQQTAFHLHWTSNITTIHNMVSKSNIKNGLRIPASKEATPESSTIQLTDPPLYSIFGGRNSIDSENENGSPEIENKEKKNDQSTKFNPSNSNTFINKYILTLILIPVFGILITSLFDNIRISNPNTIPTDYLLYFARADEYQSIILISYILFSFISFISRRLNEIPISGLGKENTNDFSSSSSFLKLLVVIFGVVFYFKKINFNLQIRESLFSLALIDFFSCFYFGFSLVENLTALILSVMTYIIDYYEIFLPFESNSISIWRCLFVFFIAIVFTQLKKYILLNF